MRKLFTTLMVATAMLVATMATAAEGSATIVTETYSIKSNYTAISVTNMIEVVLVDAPKNSIRVETDERLMPYLQIVVKNGVLVLNFDDQREVERLRKRNLNLADTRVYVSARGVDTFTASGMSEFEADIPIAASTITISASGMSSFDFERVECKTFSLSISGKTEVDAKLQADKCDLSVSGMSEVDLEGRTDRLSLRLSGMSEVSLDELHARTAEVYVSGMSEAEVNASESITGGVSGMSDLTTFGSANVNISTSGGGSHKHVKK
ncbi:MAG: DUF2807 domain-containing protein [Rikenellaceae bacterium]|nr:DUF2807 domain-containing protein [Rikenellaceae bacterium]MBR3801718.1 DUF2807 domain-containing protein [Rikenellaceae bacterium]